MTEYDVKIVNFDPFDETIICKLNNTEKTPDLKLSWDKTKSRNFKTTDSLGDCFLIEAEKSVKRACIVNIRYVQITETKRDDELTLFLIDDGKEIKASLSNMCVPLGKPENLGFQSLTFKLKLFIEKMDSDKKLVVSTVVEYLRKSDTEVKALLECHESWLVPMVPIRGELLIAGQSLNRVLAPGKISNQINEVKNPNKQVSSLNVPKAVVESSLEKTKSTKQILKPTKIESPVQKSENKVTKASTEPKKVQATRFHLTPRDIQNGDILEIIKLDKFPVVIPVTGYDILVSIKAGSYNFNVI